jgi:hypothetical protein
MRLLEHLKHDILCHSIATEGTIATGLHPQVSGWYVRTSPSYNKSNESYQIERALQARVQQSSSDKRAHDDQPQITRPIPVSNPGTRSSRMGCCFEQCFDATYLTAIKLVALQLAPESCHNVW